MKKPILIDALHINMGGALMILNHLVDRLVARNIPFVLLKDDRCPKLRSEDAVPQIEIMSCKESIRKRYYKDNYNAYSTILCLGNIPPAIRMPVKVNTYIHNVSLLKIPEDYPFAEKVRTYIKRAYIRHFAKDTDTWIVQTTNTLDLVRQSLPCKDKTTLIYPFYHLPKDIKPDNPIADRQDYIFVGDHTNAKGHEYLIEAWKLLAAKGFSKKLHLTVSKPEICDMIQKARQAGANIENHGYITFNKVVQLYQRSKATIYPSLNESLGLGIIEAASAGCDVIGCDLPYIKCVCYPSGVFAPKNAMAIMEAVLEYEKGHTSPTQLLIRDKADELIDYMIKSDYINV